MLYSCIVAFSMYSKIPMPKVQWTEKNMRYALCFFPWIGCIIGAITIGGYYGLQYFKMGNLFQTAIYLVIPLLITGGIHLDGFIDTIDGISSYQEKERKIEILKDPHTGAFAIIGVLIYYLIAFAFMSEITERSIWLIAIGYGYSRALSGLGVVTLKPAKVDGLAATFAMQAKKKHVRNIMILYSVIFIAAMLYLSFVSGVVITLVGLGTFFYYRYIAYKEFGGITGDLAGYFLQLCELMILITAVLCER